MRPTNIILSTKGQNQPKLISRVTGDKATIVKLQQAGYERLVSWESKVQEIECIEYSGGTLKWHWIRYCKRSVEYEPTLTRLQH